jgi:CMP-N-acetylneuraminic acid synthetase
MISFMDQSKADGVKSVMPSPIHPYKMWQFEGQAAVPVGGSGKLVPVFDNDFRRIHGPDQPRQLLQKEFPVYLQDGRIDITRRKFVIRPECLEHDNVWGPDIRGYVLDPRTSTDVDNPDDIRRAEIVFQQLNAEREKDGG